MQTGTQTSCGSSRWDGKRWRKAASQQVSESASPQTNRLRDAEPDFLCVRFCGYCPRADSIADVTCGESGVVAGSNRATGLPLRSNRNLVKFHLMSPANCGSVEESVRKW